MDAPPSAQLRFEEVVAYRRRVQLQKGLWCALAEAVREDSHRLRAYAQQLLTCSRDIRQRQVALHATAQQGASQGHVICRPQRPL